MDRLSIKMSQQEWSSIAKQRSKAMLMRKEILDICMRKDKALIKII